MLSTLLSWSLSRSLSCVRSVRFERAWYRSRGVVVALLSCALFTPGVHAQSPAARDTATVLRALAAAKDGERIPLLVELATLRRDEPARVLQLTSEALALLSRFPSSRDEVRARLASAYALQLQGDYPPALAEAERAQRISAEWRAAGDAISPADRELTADALYHVGYVQWRMAQYGDALANAERARTLLRPMGNSAMLAKTLSLVGAVHYAQSQFAEALQEYLASLHMSEAIGDEIAMGRAHNNIGLVLLDLNRKQEGYEALQRALAIHDRLGPRQFLVNTLNNIGLALLELERPREALPYLRRAMAMDQATGNRYGEAKENSNIGFAYEKLHETDVALEYHQKALALREEIGDKDGMVRSIGAIAEIHLKQGDTRGAIPLFERAVALAREINDRRDESDQLKLLSQARAAEGDTAGAFRDFQRFHELHATLNDSTLHRQIAEVEARYQALARKRELASVSALAESRRTKVQGLVAGSTLLVAGLALLGMLYVGRGRAQRALGESEQRYRALFQASATPTFLAEVESRRIVDRNGPARALCATVPATEHELLALEPDWVRRALQRALDSSHGQEVALDDVWTDASGGQRWTEVRGSPVALGGRSCLLVTVRDTTEQRQQEAARQREDKLQSLGVLAGGIAHDFNNALTAILGHIALARLGNEQDRREMLAGAESAAVGASRLTAQLLAFAKGGMPVRRSTDVARLLRDAVALAGAGSHMRIDLELPDHLWHAHVDSGQFSQVVSNIVINAQQATGEGGRLIVRASNVRGGLPSSGANDAPGNATPVAQDLRYVRIDFEDNGAGIPEGIRSRVFDPYFTTKSGGSGLGLATAFAICRNHGGALSFESREGVGTTFHAYFPATSEAVAPPASPGVVTPDGHGSILVLDDEPLVRTMLTRMLAHWGFEVESVSDGRAAVDRYVARMRAGRPFDLLIMDLTIAGGMGGRQAMAEILKHDPSARAIVASGYSDDPTMAHYREAGFQGALAKPFQREQLAQAVNAVLSRNASTSAH